MMWALSMCHEIIENAWLSQLLQKWVLFDHGMLKWAYPLPCFFFWLGQLGLKTTTKRGLPLPLGFGVGTITVGQRSWAAP